MTDKHKLSTIEDETQEYKILEMKVMPDHIHMFIEAKPFDTPTSIVKILKGVTSLRLLKRFPQLHKRLWRGVLWSPSYYVGTAGHVSAETTEIYSCAGAAFILWLKPEVFCRQIL